MKWQLYDHLIETIPSDLRVEDCLAGWHWCAVRSEGLGLAMTPREGMLSLSNSGSLRGQRLRDLASRIKSWDLAEAAMGLAAVNSFFNAPSVLPLYFSKESLQYAEQNSFEALEPQLAGKKVAVIGHFRNLERLQQLAKVSILERIPQDGDFPDPACEYVLPEQEYVFITGTTLINKTLPRLLELARQAEVILTGPSTPCAPFLFDYGVSRLGTMVAVDQDSLWRCIQEGGHHQIFDQGGRMLQLSPSSKVGG